MPGPIPREATEHDPCKSVGSCKTRGSSSHKSERSSLTSDSESSEGDAQQHDGSAV